VQLLVYRLAVSYASPGDSVRIKERLKLVAPGGTCPPPDDFAAANWCYTCYDVCDLQGF